MASLASSNFFAHRMLTDQGACTHEHNPDSFEDDGDGESGPHLTGGPAFDRYYSESHELIIDEHGMLVHTSEIDWNWFRFLEEVEASNADRNLDSTWNYQRKRGAGEDWIVIMRDEDGPWFACWGGVGWTEDAGERGYFQQARALQIAEAFNTRPHDMLTSKASVRAILPGIHYYKGFAVLCRYWTTAELKKIDETLPETGSSQAPGWYWDEIDSDDLVPCGAPCGPYASEIEARDKWLEMARKVV
jgi:hypothetical protein